MSRSIQEERPQLTATGPGHVGDAAAPGLDSVVDPRWGDFGDDASSPKQKSLLAIAGSLLAEISLTKLVLAWIASILLPAAILGLAPLVATAWVGFDQERSLGAGEEGGHAALPMWVYFMGEALRGQPERRLPQPDGIVSARVSPDTGQLAKAGDPSAVFELFLSGKVPGSGGLPGDGAAVSSEQQSKDSDEPIF